MMNSEKKVYKGLKWLFSFFVGIMGVATVGFIVLFTILNLPAVSQELAALVDGLPADMASILVMSSPLFVLSMIANFVLYGVVFYLGRKFFKNLEIDQIFVETNVVTAKKIALILLILSVSTCLPELFANMNGVVMGDSAFLDLTYIVGAAIVWALAKILEKANIIAEENELTI